MSRLLNDKVNRLDAINNLAPGSACRLEEDGKTFMYFRNRAGLAQPTVAEVDAEVIRLQTSYDAQEYARNRQAEYPDTGTQFNKIYDDGIDAWKADMVDPVKAKYPKPE